MNMAEQIFLTSLNQMKAILDIGEFKFGKSSDEFKFFKKQVMDAMYKNLGELFKKLEDEDLLEHCKCKSNMRHGYTDCPQCHGAGYVNCKNEK